VISRDGHKPPRFGHFAAGHFAARATIPETPIISRNSTENRKIHPVQAVFVLMKRLNYRWIIRFNMGSIRPRKLFNSWIGDLRCSVSSSSRGRFLEISAGLEGKVAASGAVSLPILASMSRRATANGWRGLGSPLAREGHLNIASFAGHVF
jgi:hypothetical protein